MLARKGYYDEMTNTFEDIKAKRDVVEKEITALLDEKEEVEKRMKEAQAELEAVQASNKASQKAKRKTDRILRQLEAGGSIARQALRRLQLSRMPLAERVANVRKDFREAALSNITPSSPVSRQRVKVDDLQMILPAAGEGGEDGEQGTEEVALALRRFMPQGLSEPPVIVFFHGESYVAGDLDTRLDVRIAGGSVPGFGGFGGVPAASRSSVSGSLPGLLRSCLLGRRRWPRLLASPFGSCGRRSWRRTSCGVCLAGRGGRTQNSFAGSLLPMARREADEPSYA